MLTYGQIDTPDSFYGIICERVIPIRQLPGCGNLNQLVFVNTSVLISVLAPYPQPFGSSVNTPVTVNTKQRSQLKPTDNNICVQNASVTNIPKLKLNFNAICKKAITQCDTFDLNFVVQNIFTNTKKLFDSICLNKSPIKSSFYLINGFELNFITFQHLFFHTGNSSQIFHLLRYCEKVTTKAMVLKIK